MFLALCQVTMGSDSTTDEIIETSVEPSKPDEDEKCEEVDAGLSKTHICDFPGCNARFSRPWKLSAHRCTHTGERPFKCNALGCNKSYTNLTHLRRHKHNQHNVNGGEKEKLPDSAKLKCLHIGCYRLFSKKEYLKKHILRKHNPDRPVIKCTECDETLSDYTRLRWHMYRHEESRKNNKKRKTYTCPYGDCPEGAGIEFANYNKLRTHLAMTHPSKFQCDICDKVFTLNCRLKLHKLSCGSDKNCKQFKCVVDGCNHMFKFRRNMLQHVEHRHAGFKYTCTFENCGKTFVWKASFNKHLRCHNLENNVVAIIKEVDDDKEKGGGREEGGGGDGNDVDGTAEIKKPDKSNVEKSRQRKRRKDADIPRQTVAELLSGVEVDS